MNDDTHSFGRIEAIADAYVGHLARHYDHPAAAIWKLLTDSNGLPQWLAPGTIELKAGGHVHIDFADSGIVIDSSVSAFEDGTLIEYSWSSGDQPERPLRWRLLPDTDGTRVELTVTVPKSEDPVKACAGFEGHLEMLAAALEGVPIKFPFDLFLEARKAYQASFTP